MKLITDTALSQQKRLKDTTNSIKNKQIGIDIQIRAKCIFLYEIFLVSINQSMNMI